MSLDRVDHHSISGSWGRRKLTGAVNLALLPDGMEYISLCNNHLAGEIGLTQVLKGMNVLWLPYNQFMEK